MDATNRPLRIPPDFATYAEKHDIFEMYKNLMETLLVTRPDDPIAFLIQQLKKDEDNVPQVIVLGPPASGKRSIGKLASNRLQVPHLTPDSIIEEADTALKKKALVIKAAGGVITTDMWVQMVKTRLGLFDCVRKGWVMDSFPQTREQALALQSAGITPKHVVLLEAPDTVLIERAAGKRIDPKTGDVYHVTFDWPGTSDVIGRLEEVAGNTEEEIVDRLVTYHRHIDGILRCYGHVYKAFNADQPRSDVLAQAMTYLSRKPRSIAPHTPRIVLLGVTGSGKAVQAALLANKYNIVNVSMGKLIKQTLADETDAGVACRPYVDKNMLVPDAIVLSILQDRLTQLDCVSRGWVLHGYPHTREQGEQLAGAGLAPNRVFFLGVPNDSVIERLTLRATDLITGQRYHMLYNPPRTQEVKDRLKVHDKDTEVEVRKRLSEYHAYSEELQDYYTCGQHVNADQDPHTVFESLESMITNQLPRTFPEA